MATASIIHRPAGSTTRSIASAEMVHVPAASCCSTAVGILPAPEAAGSSQTITGEPVRTSVIETICDPPCQANDRSLVRGTVGVPARLGALKVTFAGIVSSAFQPGTSAPGALSVRLVPGGQRRAVLLSA